MTTPRQFIALYDRLLARRNHEDFQCGVLASTIANFSMARDPDRPPLQPNDLFPSLPVPEPEEMSVEEIKAVMDQIMARQNGQPLPS